MADCEVEFPESIVYIVYTTIWGLFAVWWLVNTYYINNWHTQPLQKIMGFIVIFKVLNEAFVAAQLSSCGDTVAQTYWSLAVTSTYTLYNTFVYTCLLLISKGFCIIREALERSEVTLIAMTMGAVYLSFSAFMIDPKKLLILLAVVLSVLFYMCSHYSKACLTSLSVRYRDLRESGITAMLDSVQKKVKAFRQFRLLFFFYFIEQLVSVIFFQFLVKFVVTPSQWYWLFIGVISETLETSVLLWVMVMFRSRNHGQFANLEQIGPENDLQPIVPLVDGSIPRGSGVDFADVSCTVPLLVMTPHEFNSEQPYSGLLVATRLRSRQSEAFLHEE